MLANVDVRGRTGPVRAVHGRREFAVLAETRRQKSKKPTSRRCLELRRAGSAASTRAAHLRVATAELMATSPIARRPAPLLATLYCAL